MSGAEVPARPHASPRVTGRGQGEQAGSRVQVSARGRKAGASTAVRMGTHPERGQSDTRVPTRTPRWRGKVRNNVAAPSSFPLSYSDWVLQGLIHCSLARGPDALVMGSWLHCEHRTSRFGRDGWAAPPPRFTSERAGARNSRRQLLLAQSKPPPLSGSTHLGAGRDQDSGPSRFQVCRARVRARPSPPRSPPRSIKSRKVSLAIGCKPKRLYFLPLQDQTQTD